MKTIACSKIVQSWKKRTPGTFIANFEYIHRNSQSQMEFT